MPETVLIVVAHSDDETISMAGTIKKHVSKGDKVYAVSMTNGVGARSGVSNNAVLARKKASILASKILGFEWVACFDFKDNAMDSHALLDVIKSIESIKQKYKPSLVYTHSAVDLNVDHRVVANAVLTAFRPQPLEHCKEIRLFEVASSTDFGVPAINGSFKPNLFVEITLEWGAKLEALKV